MEVSPRAASRCFIFMYFFLPRWLPDRWRSQAQNSMKTELPSGKLLTIRVRQQIFRFSCLITLLIRMRGKHLLGKSQWVRVSSMPSFTFCFAFFNFIERNPSSIALAFSRAVFLLFWAWTALSILATCFTLVRGVTAKSTLLVDKGKLMRTPMVCSDSTFLSTLTWSLFSTDAGGEIQA